MVTFCPTTRAKLTIQNADLASFLQFISFRQNFIEELYQLVVVIKVCVRGHDIPVNLAVTQHEVPLLLLGLAATTQPLRARKPLVPLVIARKWHHAVPGFIHFPYEVNFALRNVFFLPVFLLTNPNTLCFSLRLLF